MTRKRKLLSILGGVLTLILAFVLFIYPDDGYIIILYVISFSMLGYAIKELIFYFTMAKHMVGGRISIYKGVILLDFAFFTASLSDVPHVFVMLYLLAIHAFSGTIEILRAIEIIKSGSSHYKLKLSHGIVDVAIAVICAVNLKSLHMVVYIYGVGLVYTAVMRIVAGLRNTKNVYISAV